jgi:hypothetical protein
MENFGCHDQSLAEIGRLLPDMFPFSGLQKRHFGNNVARAMQSRNRKIIPYFRALSGRPAQWQAAVCCAAQGCRAELTGRYC